MTVRDFGWALGGFWACAALWVVALWWHDQKSGVGQVKEVPSAMYSFRESYEDSEREKMMRQVDRMAETHEQIKVASQTNEAAFIKKWAAFEKRLKQLEIQLATQIDAINQYKGQQEIMAAQQPKAPLPAPQLVRLAKEVGFTKVEVRP